MLFVSYEAFVKVVCFALSVNACLSLLDAGNNICTRLYAENAVGARITNNVHVCVNCCSVVKGGQCV